MDDEMLSMNLDLNLGPLDNPGDGAEDGSSMIPVNVTLAEWLEGPLAPIHRIREASRQRRQRFRSMWGQVPLPNEARNVALELIGGGRLQTGEGSIAAEERPSEVAKASENNNGFLEDETTRKKEEDEKGNGDEGSFFDCNICLDLARDPVVTCCGHLFCWPCLYRWLTIHSDAKECPVCKGEVTTKNVTPIFGRANTSVREVEDGSSLKIPPRPQARRVESWRQAMQRTAFTIPMEEMIRRLGSRFDLSRDLIQVQPQSSDVPQEASERTNSLLSRILTSRGMRREHNNVVPSEDLVDLTQSIPSNSEMGESRRLTSLLLRRTNTHRAATISHLTAAVSSAERLVETYFRNNSVERNQEQPLPVDDRDSVSSIAAVIHSESQTADNAVEIDSRVSLSTSSSRRRNDASRISDVDSGDSRAPRRRRLH